MPKTRRQFTPEERLSALQEAERQGRTEALRKYSIAPSLFDRWRRKFLTAGVDGLKSAYKRTDPHVDFYNNRRLHGGIGFKTPQQHWDEHQNNNFNPSGEAEAGSAEEQPARNSLTSEKRPEGASQNVACPTYFLC